MPRTDGSPQSRNTGLGASAQPANHPRKPFAQAHGPLRRLLSGFQSRHNDMKQCKGSRIGAQSWIGVLCLAPILLASGPNDPAGATPPPVAGPSTPASPDPDPSVPDASAADLERAEALEAMRKEEAGLVEARVLLRTGRELTGLLVQKDDRHVTLRVNGDDVKLDLADSVEFEVLGPVLENYRSLRAATPDEDHAGRLYLIRWLQDRGAYLKALEEVEALLEEEPFNQDAAQLHVWLKQQVKLRLNARLKKHTSPRPLPRRKIHDFPVLTPEEINLIRVYEVNFADPPRLVITRKTIEEFIDLYGKNELMPKTPEGRRSLLRRDPLTVLDLMFRVQARPLYGEVKVLEDPASMAAFRTQVHRTWLVGANSSCASSSCHGGQEAGRLYLNNHRPNTDATVYTNFLILDRFRLRDGTPLINYDEPAKSPLLQMALPRDRSLYPHPNVSRGAGRRGWRPFFRDENDLRFRRAVEWIRSMYKPHPDYPIEYKPPVPRGAIRTDDLPPQGER